MGYQAYEDTFIGRPLIQWRAVFGGGILGLASMVVLTTLWLALAYASDIDTVRANMDWFLAGSAIASMLLGGFLAGWLSGVRGAAAGMVNGSTVWAVALIVTVAVAVPATVTRISDAQISTFSSEATWTTLWSLLTGFGCAAIGGVMGGAIPRARRRVARTRDEAGGDVTVHDHMAWPDALETERDRRETERLNAQAERLHEEAERRRAS